MSRKTRKLSIAKVLGASRLVSRLISNTCQAMEVIIYDKLYQKAEPQSIRNVLEWFFLDRRYKYIRLISDDRRFRIWKLHGGYAVIAETRSEDCWEYCHEFSTKSEKEVIRVLECYARTVSEIEDME